jgi:transposase-like protein
MLAELTQSTTTIAEGARQAGVSPNAVRKWIRAGHIEAVPTPLGKLVVRESLNEYLRDRAQVGEKAIASR